MLDPKDVAQEVIGSFGLPSDSVAIGITFPLMSFEVFEEIQKRWLERDCEQHGWHLRDVTVLGMVGFGDGLK